MSTYRCSKCNYDILIEMKEKHDEYCKDLPGIDELNNYIPCDLCGEIINIENYERHIAACKAVDIFYQHIKNPFLLGNIILSLQNSPSYNIGNRNGLGINLEIGGETIFQEIEPILKLLNPEEAEKENSELIVDMIEILRNELTYDEYQSNIELGEQIGKVEIGVDDINKVTIEVNENFKDLKCPICQEELNELEKKRRTICDHIFCSECISEWLSKNKTCPVCNKELQ